jgi:hypothetical protein
MLGETMRNAAFAATAAHCADSVKIAAPISDNLGCDEDKSRKRTAQAQPSHVAATPEKVLRSFNTWAFKREHPAEPDLMTSHIADAMARAEPLSFVLYWGKGLRHEIAAPDVECLDFLKMLARRVRDAYDKGAAITLVFTDTHAELNGHAAQSIRDYFGAIERLARERGFDACWLGDLCHSPALNASHDRCDQPVSIDVLRKLADCAERWYRGWGTPEQGARKYYQMNMIEKRAVELAFPRSIFITFNGSEFRCLFPDRLPIFHMYSLRRGVSVKPWFLPAPDAPIEAKLAG